MIGDLVLVGLAIWRAASLFNRERGPFDVFLRLRIKAGIVHDPAGLPSEWPSVYLAELLACPFCLSLFLAIAATPVYIFAPDVLRMICFPLAASTVAITAHRAIHGNS